MVMPGSDSPCSGPTTWIMPLLGCIMPQFAADFILKAGNYTSKKNTTLAYAVYSIWFIGNYIPLYLTRESYFADLVSGYGQEYVDTLRAYTPGWMFLVLLAACFIGGLIGAALGKAVLKKHFVRAGIV